MYVCTMSVLSSLYFAEAANKFFEVSQKQLQHEEIILIRVIGLSAQLSNQFGTKTKPEKSNTGR